MSVRVNIGHFMVHNPDKNSFTTQLLCFEA
jgi:hypothetical protein